MHAQQPVLVIGGTRGTGLLIARLLHHQGTPVRVLARDPARARSLLDPAIGILNGDLTRPQTLPPAIAESRELVFTAGCRSGYPVRESSVRATEYEGVLNTLAAARQVGFTGRLLYMTSSGLLTPSFMTRALNAWKGNTLLWRRRAEEVLRRSGLDYTVIRTGMLVNRPAGQHQIEFTQRPLPLSVRYRISRGDVARVFVAALEHPRASRTTFEVVWGRQGPPALLHDLLETLRPDPLPRADDSEEPFRD